MQGVRGSHVTILEATEVLLEFEMEEEPDEGLNTVQAHTSWLLVRRVASASVKRDRREFKSGDCRASRRRVRM